MCESDRLVGDRVLQVRPTEDEDLMSSCARLKGVAEEKCPSLRNSGGIDPVLHVHEKMSDANPRLMCSRCLLSPLQAKLGEEAKAVWFCINRNRPCLADVVHY